MSPRKPKPKPKPKVPVPVPDPEISITVEGPPERPKVMERIAAKTGSKTYRYLETFFFVASGAQLILLGMVETLHRAGVKLGSGASDHGFPWGTLIGSVIMVAPKLVGRAFAGRALVAIAGRGGDNGGETGVTSEQATGKGGE